MLEDPRANRADRFGLGPDEGLRQVGELRRGADPLSIDVDQRAPRVEEDRLDSLHVSSARTAVSSSSAIDTTFSLSDPSTRIRRRGSVPE
jgi:hypothetical protein